jgi:tRNA threonylcarbamoyladenosine biosynthesis protein TsaB
MRALAIDTSTHRAEVALWDGHACVARDRNLDPSKHAESLLNLVDGLFRVAGWRKSDLGLVVPCLGPGSFTGVRIGLATAKGIALGLDIPLVGVCGLEAMASALVAEDPESTRTSDAIVAMIDARKGEVFLAAYGPTGSLLDGPRHVAAGRVNEALETYPPKRIVVGEVAASLALPGARLVRGPSTDLPDAAAVARLGVQKLEERGPDDVAALEPIYVRPPDITLPRPK